MARAVSERILLACILLLPLSALAAQQNPLPASASAQADNQTATIEGSVVNAETGEPIAHASLMLFARMSSRNGRLEPRQASTDLSGRFSIGDLSAGRYRLRADADHFAPQAYGAHSGGRRPGSDLVVDAGQHVRDLVLRLPPCGSISGTVSDENGKPVVDATVRALPVTPGSGSQQAQTDSHGQYRVTDLVPDQYYVQVTSSRETAERATRAAQEIYPPTYYPATADAETAVSIAVVPGGDVDRIDLDLRAVHAVQVRGQVVDPDTNQPAHDGWVMLIPRRADGASRLGAIAALSASRYGSDVKDAQGHFEIDGVTPGSYWVFGNVPDKNGSNVGRTPLEVGDADVQGVRLAVGANVEVAGRIHAESGNGVDFSKLTVLLLPQEPLISRHEEQPAPSGDFALHDVEPGSYRVSVQGAPAGYYLKSARLGGGDVLDSGLTVDPATSAAALDILLSAPGGGVSGLVLNDDAPAQATVCLVPNAPRRDRRDLYLRAPTRPDGTFSIPGIAPGDYKLFAFEDADLRILFNPALLGAYEPRGESVKVEEGHTESVRLDVIPADDQP